MRAASVPELSDLERAKTLLVLLEMHIKSHPDENDFYFLPDRLPSPLRDQFDTQKALNTILKESRGNIQGKYEIADVYLGDQKVGMSRKLHLRIKDFAQFGKDVKKIFAKRDRKDENAIYRIEIFEPRGGFNDQLRVYINGDYSNKKITPNKNGKYWKIFLMIARERGVTCANHRQASNVRGFFNNVPGNVLYSRTEYQPPQRILTVDGRKGKTLIPLVPIELLDGDVGPA